MNSRSFIAALFLLGLSTSTAALAQGNPCRMDDGYIDNGIGGTGNTETVTEEEDDDGKGIGGTGHKPKGIGGTGKEMAAKKIYVTGTVYAFGSVCVNGIRVTYEDNTPIKDSGKIVKQDALKIGHVVRVVAEKTDTPGQLHARSIEISRAVQGPVTHIDLNRNSIRVLGERIAVTDKNSLNGIGIGQKVQVSGLRNSSNTIIATRVDSPGSLAKAGVEGVVRKSADGETFVGNTRVSIPKDKTDLYNGSSVKISGQWSGDKLILEDFENQEKVLSKVDYASIETFVDGTEPVDPALRNSSALQEDGRAILSGPVINGKVVPERVKSLSFDDQQFLRDDRQGKSSDNDEDDNSGKGGNNNEIEREDSEDHDNDSTDDSNDVREDSADNDRPDDSDNSDDIERQDNSGHGNSDDRPERVDAEKNEIDTPERIERPEDNKPEKIERPEDDAPERIERIERPDDDTPEVDDRPDRPDDSHRGRGRGGDD